jgi:hypothetical protein
MTAAVQKFLTPKELVARWGGATTVGTLANWRCQEKGPPYSKRGAKVVYPLDKLEVWEAANDNNSNNEQK